LLNRRLLINGRRNWEVIAMPRNTVYLEAPERTQDLLNIKWILRSAGYTIGSIWHEGNGSRPPLPRTNHWNAKALELLQFCDSLIVVTGKTGCTTPELAIMAGFALARGIRVIWIGEAVDILRDFPAAVQNFEDAEEFRRALVEQMYVQSKVLERLAA
jgi:hypothetical protein